MLERSTGRKPRVLLDLLAYAPSDGGFTTSIHALLEVARKLREYEFGIVYHERFRERFAAEPLQHHPIAFPRKFKFFASLAFVPHVARRFHYDAVHADITLVAPDTPVPASIRIHDLYYMRNRDVREESAVLRCFEDLYRRLYNDSIRRAALVGAISECTRRDITEFIGRTRGIVLLPHAVSVPSRPPTPRAWPEGTEPLKLIFVGSIVPRKNLQLLLRALPFLCRPWTLDLVGNLWWGSKEIENLCKDARITVHGFVETARLNSLLRNAHLLVNPSLYEGFGLPVAEAVSDGCLALAAKGSAFDEFVPAGARFDPHQPEELASIINHMTATQYEALYREAFVQVSRYSKDRQVDAYGRLFAQLVAGRPRYVI